jgi:glycogen debranching enzyme
VRLVEEHVLRPDRYWRRFPIPSTAADERAYQPRTRVLRYWRGPTWIAGSWLVHRGLRQHGFTAEAAELARRTEQLIARSGFREYYDPERGDGMGARAFGMSTLAVAICDG